VAQVEQVVLTVHKVQILYLQLSHQPVAVMAHLSQVSKIQPVVLVVLVAVLLLYLLGLHRLVEQVQAVKETMAVSVLPKQLTQAVVAVVQEQ
jgi:hypothetical protein